MSMRTTEHLNFSALCAGFHRLGRELGASAATKNSTSPAPQSRAGVQNTLRVLRNPPSTFTRLGRWAEKMVSVTTSVYVQHAVATLPPAGSTSTRSGLAGKAHRPPTGVFSVAVNQLVGLQLLLDVSFSCS